MALTKQKKTTDSTKSAGTTPTNKAAASGTTAAPKVTPSKATTTAKATNSAKATTGAKAKSAPAKAASIKTETAKITENKALAARTTGTKATGRKATPTRELPRIWRSPYSFFGHDEGDYTEETMTANAVYTDEVLAGIAENGFNAIWVHGLLHHVAPTTVFPEFGEHSAEHLRNMRELIERAARHNLRVFIYMQPPRGLDARDPFWEAHPDVAGSPVENWETIDGELTTYLSMCTSVPKVKKFLRQSITQLVKELKGLGGLILITASEYPCHCYRSLPTHCPRCQQRTPAEVINEVIQIARDAVRSVSKTMEVITWNWSWSFLEADPSPTILKNLPDDVILMADFERGDTKEILGKERPMDEYSLSFAGPSKRFKGCYAAAKKRGMTIIPKLQLGTTHELGTVPNLPLIGNLYEKAYQMQQMGITGFQGCWNFGNMISANSASFNYFLNDENLPPRSEALEKFATEYFPGCNPTAARHAWEAFASAMDTYPFSIPFIYYGPMNFSIGYVSKPAPLKSTQIGRAWLNDRPRGDRMDLCIQPYSLDEIIRGMGKVARAWKRGAVLMEQALRGLDDQHSREELANAWVCYHIWRSTWNLFRIYKLRLKWDDSKLDAYLDITQDELENIQAALPYVQADKRFGYHSEAHAYLFDAGEIKKKIGSLQRQLKARANA